MGIPHIFKQDFFLDWSIPLKRVLQLFPVSKRNILVLCQQNPLEPFLNRAFPVARLLYEIRQSFYLESRKET